MFTDNKLSFDASGRKNILHGTNVHITVPSVLSDELNTESMYIKDKPRKLKALFICKQTSEVNIPNWFILQNSNCLLIIIWFQLNVYIIINFWKMIMNEWMTGTKFITYVWLFLLLNDILL